MQFTPFSIKVQLKCASSGHTVEVLRTMGQRIGNERNGGARLSGRVNRVDTGEALRSSGPGLLPAATTSRRAPDRMARSMAAVETQISAPAGVGSHAVPGGDWGPHHVATNVTGDPEAASPRGS
jgi:hypothetical protein